MGTFKVQFTVNQIIFTLNKIFEIACSLVFKKLNVNLPNSCSMTAGFQLNLKSLTLAQF